MKDELTTQEKAVRALAEHTNPYDKICPNRHLFNEGFVIGYNHGFQQSVIKDIVKAVEEKTGEEIISVTGHFKTTESQPKVSDEVIGKPKIVCICGSGRFLKEMHEVEERLTLEGKIVLMIGVNTKDVARTEDMSQYKPMLDKLHLRKIDMSDSVFVVNVDGYIGESTRKEISYSESKGKPIEYLV
jgi:hypothetical protein